jgi:SAM-dependent methyltransferase
MTTSFARYLAAKRPIDDRSLNAHVWETVAAALPQRPLSILELGAGIGTMIDRLAARDVWAPGGRYEAIDADAALIDAARERLAGAVLPFELSLQAADVFTAIARTDRAPADLLIAHAFLDLLDLPRALPVLLSALAPGGLFYFTLNFDGITILEPAIDPGFDELIMRLYHQTMDERRVDGRLSGDSRSGRHLLSLIPAVGGEVLAAGSSDWVVVPRRGGYPGDEAYFLHHILHFMETSLAGHPALDAAGFGRWLARRRAQIDAGELIYIAHQIDIAGRVGEARA